MNTILKRLGAYFIDYIIVNIAIYAIILIPFINPHNSEYQEKYNELINVNEQLNENEISEDEFYDAFVPIAYDLYRLNTNYVIISSIFFILYFGLFQYYNHGQTIGKKIFKLKIISPTNKTLTLTNYIIRALVLYNILIPILQLIVIHTMSVNTYLPVYEKINMVGYIIMYITIFMVLVRKDGRGLHDLVAVTQVQYDETLPSIIKIDKIMDYQKEMDTQKEDETTNQSSTSKDKPTKSIKKAKSVKKDKPPKTPKKTTTTNKK